MYNDLNKAFGALNEMWENDNENFSSSEMESWDLIDDWYNKLDIIDNAYAAGEISEEDFAEIRELALEAAEEQGANDVDFMGDYAREFLYEWSFKVDNIDDIPREEIIKAAKEVVENQLKYSGLEAEVYETVFEALCEPYGYAQEEWEEWKESQEE